MTDAHPLPFVDLKRQQEQVRPQIDAAITRVLDHGQYVLGPEVRELEKQLADFCGAPFALSCASGTDALLLALMAKDVGHGDAIFVPAFTFVATAEVVTLLHAKPVFVDIDADTYLMNMESLEAAIGESKKQGLTPRAIMPVDLFGQPADYEKIERIAKAHGLFVVADAAQSFGATRGGKRVGTLAPVTATSFFPPKPLGCYGDGGAVFTDDGEMLEVMQSLRVHGQGKDKYDNVRIGINGRLDTIQAAILLEKLAIFEGEIAARQRVAERYNAALGDVVQTPVVEPGATCVWAQYTIRAKTRDQVAAKLKDQGIPTAIYYPIPLHRQVAYKKFPVAPGGLPVSDKMAGEVLSLPMHPYLSEPDQNRIINAVKSACAS
ncbi:MAG: DegT/DnrJ/EryC1/StrS family aminotransferase [Nitrospira sp.]|nr:DegT/DnrJ/EryC1/StrS family aminotransferase [Nitrospira sp.]